MKKRSSLLCGDTTIFLVESRGLCRSLSDEIVYGAERPIERDFD